MVVLPLPLSPTIGQQSGSAVAPKLSKQAWIRATAILNSGYLTSTRSEGSIDSVISLLRGGGGHLRPPARSGRAWQVEGCLKHRKNLVISKDIRSASHPIRSRN